MSEQKYKCSVSKLNAQPYKNSKWREGSIMDSVLTYEQKLKLEKRKHERECVIRRAARTIKAETLEEKRARHEFNELMKERGVVL